MLKISDLYEYQKEALNFLYVRNECMLWLGMGLGKTIIALSCIAGRKKLRLVTKTLVVAPLTVVLNVWHVEAAKWEHTKDLKFSIINGTESKRMRALFKDADIYVINYESLNWLAKVLTDYYKNDTFPFQFVIYDEITRMKDSTNVMISGSTTIDENDNKTVKIGWKKIIDKFKYKCGLTGTPASNGLIDLHGQFLCVDIGKRLGYYITHFRNNYFTSDYSGYGYSPRDNTKIEIYNKIGDITLNMETLDYLDLPDIIYSYSNIKLPPKVLIKYKEFYKNLISEIEKGVIIEVESRLGSLSKCMQICNGNLYIDDDNNNYHQYHQLKLKALKEVLKSFNADVVFIAYNFTSDAQVINKALKKSVLMKDYKTNLQELIKKIKKGKIKYIIGHPKSVGHGLDGLQTVCNHIIFYGLLYSLDQHQQLIARIYRNGQKKITYVHAILAQDTIDFTMKEILEGKDETQQEFKRLFKM